MEIISYAGAVTSAVARFIDDIRENNPKGNLESMSVERVDDHQNQRQLRIIGKSIKLTHLVQSYTEGIRVIDLETHRSNKFSLVIITLQLD